VFINQTLQHCRPPGRQGWNGYRGRPAASRPIFVIYTWTTE
jgi:hypothetical protein